MNPEELFADDRSPAFEQKRVREDELHSLMRSILDWAISFLSESSQGTIRAIYFEGKTVKHHELARDPDPVDVEHAVELAAGDGHRPGLPELGRPAPEGPPAARHHALRVLREEPPEELLEPRRRVVVPQRRRGAAGRVPPALGPR